jgi:2'-hydroxyisoflavone reductase
VKILILGGTVFLGRHFVEAAVARGHEVTLFNRGRHNPQLFAEHERLRGDRDSDLAALRGRRWDAVVDPSGYIPRHVRATAGLLADRVDRYLFISTISVYADGKGPGPDEGSPLETLADESTEEVTGETYGGLKVLCEQAAEAMMPGRTLIVRPGLIVGPHDPTDRFTYWPWRIAQGGEVLAPGDPAAPVQIIDVRDLATWLVDQLEAEGTGIFNATGPDYGLTMGEVLATCQRVVGTPAELVWVGADFLQEQGAKPWVEVPLWLPGEEGVRLMQTNVERALAAGLRFRPLAETTADTLAWAQERPGDHEWRAGLAPEKERAILAAWRADR